MKERHTAVFELQASSQKILIWHAQILPTSCPSMNRRQLRSAEAWSNILMRSLTSLKRKKNICLVLSTSPVNCCSFLWRYCQEIQLSHIFHAQCIRKYGRTNICDFLTKTWQMFKYCMKQLIFNWKTNINHLYYSNYCYLPTGKLKACQVLCSYQMWQLENICY